MSVSVSYKISWTEYCQNIYKYTSLHCAEIKRMFTCFQASFQCFAKKKNAVSLLHNSRKCKIMAVNIINVKVHYAH